MLIDMGTLYTGNGFIHPSIHSFIHRDFLSACYTSGVVLGIRESAVNKTDKAPALIPLTFYSGPGQTQADSR